MSTRLEGGGQLGIRAPEPVVVGARGADQGERPRSGAFGAGGCAALRSDALSREPFVKGDPPGWASPGGSGNREAGSREPGVDSVVPDP